MGLFAYNLKRYGIQNPPGGAVTWDATLTQGSDLLQASDVAQERPSAFAVASLPYGVYAFELRLLFTSTAGFSSLKPFECEGANTGEAYPRFVSSEYFGIWDNSRGVEWTGSGGSSQADPFTANTATDATAREFEAYARGLFYHFDHNDGFFGQNFVPGFEATSGNTNGVTLKAGSFFRYRLEYAPLIATP